jgi:predicted NACHT family NTPase
MKKNPYVVSPACQEALNKGYASNTGFLEYSDVPVWAILEQIEVILKNGDSTTYLEPVADLISVVRERLPKLDADDVAQHNSVQTESDWEAYLEWEEDQKRDANWNWDIDLEEGC